eukprot:10944375-Karenia_brevis.AAC.1
MKQTLQAQQSVDQAGFRSGFSCDDHLQTVVLLIEACTEYQVDLWICAVDYCKAFDTVEHASIWAALKNQGVDERYINLLATLYEGQT